VSRGIGRAIAERRRRRCRTDVADVHATARLLAVAADVTEETGRKAIPEAALARHCASTGW